MVLRQPDRLTDWFIHSCDGHIWCDSKSRGGAAESEELEERASLGLSSTWTTNPVAIRRRREAGEQPWCGIFCQSLFSATSPAERRNHSLYLRLALSHTHPWLTNSFLLGDDDFQSTSRYTGWVSLHRWPQSNSLNWQSNQISVYRQAAADLHVEG